MGASVPGAYFSSFRMGIGSINGDSQHVFDHGGTTYTELRMSRRSVLQFLVTVLGGGGRSGCR